MNNGKDEIILKDIEVLVNFTSIFCEKNHYKNNKRFLKLNGFLGDYLNKYNLNLCKDCQNTLLHGVSKRILCPYNPKLACKKCPTMCYRNGYREKMKQIMKFSGLYFIKKGKFNYIFKYFF